MRKTRDVLESASFEVPGRYLAISNSSSAGRTARAAVANVEAIVFKELVEWCDLGDDPLALEGWGGIRGAYIEAP